MSEEVIDEVGVESEHKANVPSASARSMSLIALVAALQLLEDIAVLLITPPAAQAKVLSDSPRLNA